MHNIPRKGNKHHHFNANTNNSSVHRWDQKNFDDDTFFNCHLHTLNFFYLFFLFLLLLLKKIQRKMEFKLILNFIQAMLILTFFPFILATLYSLDLIKQKKKNHLITSLESQKKLPYFMKTKKKWGEGIQSYLIKNIEKVSREDKFVSGLDYFNLYLIHSPIGGENIRTYQVLVDLQGKGKIKFIAKKQKRDSFFGKKKEIIKHCRSKGIMVDIWNWDIDNKDIKFFDGLNENFNCTLGFQQRKTWMIFRLCFALLALFKIFIHFIFKRRMKPIDANPFL
ncbi:hypothetical protein RFI_28769 [Reticulomyxa filosa]|uniref:Uncharacterized protein n=1 Tax=Reticulomyxa filosa TaxID=46433 RepID=X6M3W3_RETFI|nr:hypothetical protein RFI_28769 [Reticulomyxa filosa]|eukprot:ETO08619.1 hypothetical protein RFI_28769 [Reticulomyxa filosa]